MFGPVIKHENNFLLCNEKGFFFSYKMTLLFSEGDSGGPLMLPIHQDGKFPVYQIGVASFTYSFARESGPDIYTNVQHFADWIKEHVEG